MASCACLPTSFMFSVLCPCPSFLLPCLSSDLLQPGREGMVFRLQKVASCCWWELQCLKICPWPTSLTTDYPTEPGLGLSTF